MDVILNIVPTLNHSCELPTNLVEAREQWVNGKDFIILRGPHCSIRDTALMKYDGHTHMRILMHLDGRIVHELVPL